MFRTTAVVTVLGLLVAACGATESPELQTPGAQTPEAQTTAPATTEGPAATQAPATTQGTTEMSDVSLMVAESSLGTILADGEGWTLYLFMSDSAGESSCYDDCEVNWPPFTEDQLGDVGEGIDASLLGTTTRTDGTVQVTYNGHPIYYFVGDAEPGDTAGQGVQGFGGLWYAVTPEGEAAQATSLPDYGYDY